MCSQQIKIQKFGMCIFKLAKTQLHISVRDHLVDNCKGVARGVLGCP